MSFLCRSSHKKLKLQLGIFLCFCTGGFLPNQAIGFNLNTKMEQATDSYASHCFHLNPATFHPNQPDHSVVQLVNYRVYKSYTHLDGQVNNEQREDGEKNESNSAGAVTAGLGQGLWLHLNGEQFSAKGRYRRDGASNNVPENLEGNLALLKTTVTLTNEVFIGFGLRYLDLKHAVVGSFSINPQQFTTTFHTSLIGFTGGFQYFTKTFALDGYYLPPLKGSSTILGEEKVITEPGHWAVGASYQGLEPLTIGIRYKKILYKKDDRPEGTTINDQNKTHINLVGLDREDIHLFPLTIMMLGMSYEFTQSFRLHLSLEKQYTSLLTQPATQTPGLDPNDPFVTRQIYKLLGMYQRSKLHFFTGIVLSDQKMDFSTGTGANTNVRIFDSKRKDLWFGVGSYL